MCIEGPKLPLPVLGFGLSIEPPSLPSFSGSLDLCCKQLPFNIVPPPIPLVLPPGALAAAMTGLGPLLHAVQDFVDGLPIDCPLE